MHRMLSVLGDAGKLVPRGRFCEPPSRFERLPAAGRTNVGPGSGLTGLAVAPSCRLSSANAKATGTGRWAGKKILSGRTRRGVPPALLYECEKKGVVKIDCWKWIENKQRATDCPRHREVLRTVPNREFLKSGMTT